MKKVLFMFVLFVSFAVALSAAVEIDMWFHSGRGDERNVIQDQVKRFNEMQDLVHVNAVILPEGSYNEQVQAAALANDLPDLLDLDGPYMTNYAWAGFLKPLDGYISEEMRSDLLPSIIKQGTYQGKLYALGTFDSGLAIWANKKYLEAVGARIPQSVEDAWTKDEFLKILSDLKALPEIDYPLDLMFSYGPGEWFAYGFSPIFQAFGADLINREDFMSAEGILNGPEAVEAAQFFQDLIQNGYVNLSPANDAAMLDGKAAMAWVGHWYFNAATDALGEDAVLIPMPKLGPADSAFGGQTTGMGSWCWGITNGSENPYAAWLFLRFIMRSEEIVKMSNANGAVPARVSAAEMSEIYKPGGPLSIYVEQANSIAVERPVTPAYPILSLEFTRALQDIANGGNIQDALDRAVEEIDWDIEDNVGYPMD
jgi:multiple sugar transport system substrate-binding protein